MRGQADLRRTDYRTALMYDMAGAIDKDHGGITCLTLLVQSCFLFKRGKYVVGKLC